MKLRLSLAMMVVLGVGAWGKEPSMVAVNFPNTDVQGVLDFYARLTRRKVEVDSTVEGLVTVVSEKPIPKEEAIKLIRTTLLEKYGIEMREPGNWDTIVTWSKDPKYQEKVEATKKAKAEISPLPPGPPPSGTPGRQRVRVIQ